MEKHVFKLSESGEFSGNGFKYDCKCVSKLKAAELINLGWAESLSSLIESKEESPELSLKQKIESLGGKVDGRSSIETLEKQLKELENEHFDEG